MLQFVKQKNKFLKFLKKYLKVNLNHQIKLVLEEFLDGEEASYFLVVDENTFKFFGTAQDHKRVGEYDKGPNTGGMGAYSPCSYN